MLATFDAVVIGSGHNGLTCACYLAKAGLRVLVLEQCLSIGGMTNTEEVTLPGFKSDTHAICFQFANFSPVLQELPLAEHGFELIYPDPCFSHGFPDGRMISVHRNLEQTCESIAQFSGKDASTWRTLFNAFFGQREQIAASFNSPPASFSDQAAALDNLSGGMDQYRFQMQTFRTWCDETFEAEQTKMLFAAWAMHAGVSPDEAGGASLAWLFPMVIQHYGNNVVKGGMCNLPAAMARFVTAQKGEIRTNARADRIIVEHGKATAVQLHDGERIPVGRLLACNAHPRHLVLDLLGEAQVGHDVASKMRRYELGESIMVVYLALDAPVSYKAGRLAGESIYVHPSPASFEYFSAMFHQLRAHRLPAEPFCLVCNDSAADPSRVPPGKALMKLVVGPVPYAIGGEVSSNGTGATWDEAKDPYADHVIGLLTRDYIPDLRDRILRKVVRSPDDLERMLPSALRGTNTHGAFVPYQIGAMRPIPEMGNYRSPVSNVYLCGAGSHPGPGVTMAPGRNAAQIIYRDLGLDFAGALGNR